MKKKHELIKYAYDNYKVGDKYRCAVDGEIFTVEKQDFAIHNNIYVRGEENKGLLYLNGKWATIIPAELEKAGLLNGKCAIQVSNEREFKLLMEHYEAKRFNPCPIQVDKIEFSTTHHIIEYSDVYVRMDESNIIATNQYKVIPFADFAAEVGVKVPVFVMKSMDGVDLYEGDKYYRVGRCKADATGDFVVYKQERLQSCHFVCCYPETDKAFSTEELALKWIEEQNKPKEIIIGEHKTSPYAIVRADRIRFTSKTDDIIYEFSGEEIQEIYATYKSLQ